MAAREPRPRCSNFKQLKMEPQSVNVNKMHCYYASDSLLILETGVFVTLCVEHVILSTYLGPTNLHFLGSPNVWFKASVSFHYCIRLC